MIDVKEEACTVKRKKSSRAMVYMITKINKIMRNKLKKYVEVCKIITINNERIRQSSVIFNANSE